MILFPLFLVFSQIILGSADNRTLPDGFEIGALTAAFAIEGAWNANGKTPSIWDHYAHHELENFYNKDPSYNITHQAEVAADSYHKWREDVRVAKEIGLTYYRFSVSWNRLLPNPLTSNANQVAVDYYNNLIDALIEANIKPAIALMNYDSRSIGDLYYGGFTNELTADIFAQYAEVAFKLFGDRVKTWITFSEPQLYCTNLTAQLPGAHINPEGFFEYECAHNIIKAHAKVYRLYEKKFKESQKGKISMCISVDWYEQASDTPEDQEASLRAMDFNFGWIAHPLVYGDYPKRMIDTIGAISEAQHYTFSRLPEFTDKEKKEIKGTLDFITILPLQTYIVSRNDTVEENSNSFNDMLVSRKLPEGVWNPNELLVKTVWGFRNSIKYIWDNYQQIPIHVTSGYGAFKDSLNDTYRVQYLQDHLKEILTLIDEEDIVVTGFGILYLIDGFIFQYALDVKYGLVHVDFNDPERPRTLKESAKYIKQVIETNKV